MAKLWVGAVSVSEHSSLPVPVPAHGLADRTLSEHVWHLRRGGIPDGTGVVSQSTSQSLIDRNMVAGQSLISQAD